MKKSIKNRINELNPDDYVKLVNIKEDLFTAEFEVTCRQYLMEKGFPNVRLIYIDGPFYFHKEDIERYDFPEQKMLEVNRFIKEEAEIYVKNSECFKADFSRMEWNQLIAYYDKFVKAWQRMLAVVDIPVYNEHNFERRVSAEIKDPELLGVLTHPFYESYNKRRDIDYHKLKLGKLKKADFMEKWEWSYSTLFEYKKLDDEVIEKAVSEIKDARQELDSMEKEEKKAKEDYDKAYSKLNERQKRIADVIQNQIFIRDYRFEMMQRGCFNIMKLFFEMAKRLGISYKEFTHMKPEEINKRAVNKDIIHKRMKEFAVFEGDILIDEEFRMIKDKFERPIVKDIVKGTPAYRGVVKGIVKIIRNRDDIGKLNKGDILVADITTPDYMIAIKKAAAIVTNIGGISSHSAIVAREFKIPCIVNTGEATMVFKDGDLVEVDADKGIVRKLKSQ